MKDYEALAKEGAYFSCGGGAMYQYPDCAHTFRMSRQLDYDV